MGKMAGCHLGFMVVTFCLASMLGQTPALDSFLSWPCWRPGACGLASGLPHLLLHRADDRALRSALLAPWELTWSVQPSEPSEAGIHLPPFTEEAE